MRSNADTSDIERLRRIVGVAGVRIAVVLLVLGTVLHALGQRTGAGFVFQAAFCVLILMPAKNVFAVLADEVRRQDWWFVLVAGGVLAELAYVVFDLLY